MIRKRPAAVALPPAYAKPELLRYAIQPQALMPGNKIQALRGGAETFPAMLEAIRDARYYVHLETYILCADRTGRRFAEALSERARAGVAVRVIYDAAGSWDLPDAYVDGLRAAGVEVVEYHPIAPWKQRFGLSRLQRRDHRKILVVDGEIGFTGGLNIGDDYAPAAEGGGGWHDMHARLEGPAVAELARLFRRTWIRSGGRPYPKHEEQAQEVVASAETAFVRTIGNEEYRRRFGIRRAYLHAMRQARLTISIMNAYFIPDRGIRRAMANAVRRGVKVRVIVPARSDVPAVQWASRHLYAGLLRAGVRIFEWTERMMHAKTAVVDSIWATIGSSNLDNRSLLYNLEVVAVAVDPAFGAAMQAQFEEEVARCREVLLDAWRRRPFWHRLVEWFFFQFRRWL